MRPFVLTVNNTGTDTRLSEELWTWDRSRDARPPGQSTEVSSGQTANTMIRPIATQLIASRFLLNDSQDAKGLIEVPNVYTMTINVAGTWVTISRWNLGIDILPFREVHAGRRYLTQQAEALRTD